MRCLSLRCDGRGFLAMRACGMAESRPVEARGVLASVANRNGERRPRGEMGKAREQPVRVEEAWRSELLVVN